MIADLPRAFEEIRRFAGRFKKTYFPRHVFNRGGRPRDARYMVANSDACGARASVAFLERFSIALLGECGLSKSRLSRDFGESHRGWRPEKSLRQSSRIRLTPAAP